MAPTDEPIDVKSTETTTDTVSDSGSHAELVPASPTALVVPAGSNADIVAAFKAYVSLKERLLDDSDYQKIGDKLWVKKSGWRKLATAFGVSGEMIDRHYDYDEQGRIVRAEVVVRATSPGGLRQMDGLGICHFRERCCTDPCPKKKWKNHTCCTAECNGLIHFSKPDHDLPATAATRALNRAFSDLFGFGEVSADEVVDDGRAGDFDPEWKALGYDNAAAFTAAGDEWHRLAKLLTDDAKDEVRAWQKLDSTGWTWPPTHAVMVLALDKLRGYVDGAPKSAGEPTTTASTDADGTDGGSGKPEVEPETARPEDAEAATDSPAALPLEDGEAPPSPVEGSGDGGGAPAPSPSPPTPPPPPATGEPSSPGERSRLAQLTKIAYPNGDDSKAAREALCSILSNERTTTSTELTGPEIKLAIKGAKLLASGNLLFAVDDGEDLVACDLGVIPPLETATLVASIPTGGDSQAGEQFIHALVAFTGVQLMEGE